MNTHTEDRNDTESGTVDVSKLSPLALAAQLMTMTLCECLAALKSNPSTEALTVARQTLQGLRFPVGPVDAIDEGLALELRSLYLQKIHAAMSAPSPTPALLREVLRFGTATGLLGSTDGKPAVLQHSGIALAERVESPLLEQAKPAMDYGDLPFFGDHNPPLLPDGSPNPGYDEWGAGGVRAGGPTKADVMAGRYRPPADDGGNVIENDVGGPGQMMRESDYADLPFAV